MSIDKESCHVEVEVTVRVRGKDGKVIGDSARKTYTRSGLYAGSTMRNNLAQKISFDAANTLDAVMLGE